ncbi:50S ribosomal protein L13 [Candidatus Roizmanbacteria bacterium]|nr:50S ribosomal protein L13 [Candidatus Roizmanbacteria bacterium]
MKQLTKTTTPIRERDIKRSWHLFDLSGKVLGRVTPGIARVLQGKHKTSYVDYLDGGDYAVVINATKVVLTGKKAQTKTYDRYSGYPSGQKVISFEKLIAVRPQEVIRIAVSGMLPKNKMRDRRLARLYIYKDNKHPYVDKFPVTES